MNSTQTQQGDVQSGHAMWNVLGKGVLGGEWAVLNISKNSGRRLWTSS